MKCTKCNGNQFVYKECDGMHLCKCQEQGEEPKMKKITEKEFNEIYEADGHTGIPKCKCCGRIDTDTSLYYEIIK